MQLVSTFVTTLLPRIGKGIAPLSVAAALALGTVLQGMPANAQGLFTPAVKINEDVITWFELEQRVQLMRLLRAPGNPEKLAREELIKDRLRRQALRSTDIKIAPEDVTAGIDNFAARTNLSGEEFLNILNENGVSRETMRDFVEIGLAWREYVGARFLAQARPSDDEIDRALARVSGGSGGVSVLLSEVILPITDFNLPEVEALAEQIAEIEDFDQFAAAAAQYSASETRLDGGKLDWLELGKLPPALRPVLLALNPGDVTTPLPLQNALALFQMRGIRETGAVAPSYSAIDYAMYYIPGGRTEPALTQAAQLRRDVDTCDDLYGVAQGQPENVLDRRSEAPGAIASDVALELAKMDANESSAVLTRNDGQTLVFVMLCGRTADFGEETSREDVANALTQQRLESFSESFLAQLRADALIVDQ